ncbi:MAG: hypothetical protein ABI728_09230 [Betaproteobacteria bacterium]
MPVAIGPRRFLPGEPPVGFSDMLFFSSTTGGKGNKATGKRGNALKRGTVSHNPAHGITSAPRPAGTL